MTVQKGDVTDNVIDVIEDERLTSMMRRGRCQQLGEVDIVDEGRSTWMMRAH